MPSAADRTAGSDSVITRRPPGRTVREMPSSLPADRRLPTVMSSRPLSGVIRPGAAGPAGASGAGIAAPATLPVAVVVAAPVPVPPVPPVAAVTRARLIGAAEVLAGRFPLHDLDWHQRQLAAVVDFADFDLDLVAHLHHVIDVVD